MRQLINYNDKMYILVRKLNKEIFPNLNFVNEYKEILHCNHVLQTQDKYLFVITVDDAEVIIEENL